MSELIDDNKKDIAIGRTRSGQIVFLNKSASEYGPNFTQEDHLDAGDIHKEFISNCKLKGNVEGQELHKSLMSEHEAAYNTGRFSKELKKGFVKDDWNSGNNPILSQRELMRNHIMKGVSGVREEYNPIQDMLEKGEISSQLAYGYGSGSQPVTFVKTGAELKTRMPDMIERLTLESGVLLGQLQPLMEQIGSEPTNVCNSSLIKMEYKLYPWQMCEAQYVNGSYAPLTEENKLCAKYNAICNMAVSMIEDAATCRVIMNNAEDSKKYTLSVSQLLALGLDKEDTIEKGEDEEDDNEEDVEKGEESDELEKGGEGSKGGKVIGHTKSGKPIYANKNADHEVYKDFSKEEHKEARWHHMEHSKTGTGKTANSKKAKIHQNIADTHYNAYKDSKE